MHVLIPGGKAKKAIEKLNKIFKNIWLAQQEVRKDK